MQNNSTSELFLHSFNDLREKDSNFPVKAPHGIVVTMEEYRKFSKGPYAIDPDRIFACTGMRSAEDFRLPFDLVEAIVDPCKDLVFHLAQEAPAGRELSAADIARQPAAQTALAKLYAWLACYGATRLLVPLDAACDWPLVTRLIQNCHLAVSGAPPLPLLRIEYVGTSLSKTKVVETRRARSQPKQSRQPWEVQSYNQTAEMTGHAAWFKKLTTVDRTLMVELLGFRPPHDFRLPLHHVRAVQTAEQDAYISTLYHGDLNEDGTPALHGIISFVDMVEALRNLYGLFTLLGATRCPVPFGPHSTTRDRISYCVKNAWITVENAPALDVPIIFIGQTPTD